MSCMYTSRTMLYIHIPYHMGHICYDRQPVLPFMGQANLPRRSHHFEPHWLFLLLEEEVGTVSYTHLTLPTKRIV